MRVLSRESRSAAAIPLVLLALSGYVYPIAAAAIVLSYGIIMKDINPLSGEAFIFAGSFISVEYDYVTARWPQLETQRSLFILFEYLFLCLVLLLALRFIVLNIVSIFYADGKTADWVNQDREIKSFGAFLRKRANLIFPLALMAVGVFLITHIKEQMRVDMLQNWIQHSVSTYIAMQIFVLSVGILFLTDSVSVLAWKYRQFSKQEG